MSIYGYEWRCCTFSTIWTKSQHTKWKWMKWLKCVCTHSDDGTNVRLNANIVTHHSAVWNQITEVNRNCNLEHLKFVASQYIAIHYNIAYCIHTSMVHTWHISTYIIVNINEEPNIPNLDTYIYIKNMKQTSVKFQGGLVSCNKQETTKPQKQVEIYHIKFSFPS